MPGKKKLVICVGLILSIFLLVSVYKTPNDLRAKADPPQDKPETEGGDTKKDSPPVELNLPFKTPGLCARLFS